LIRFEKKDIQTQSVSDFGVTVELYVEHEKKAIDYPLLKVYADEKTDEHYLEISTSNELVQIPIESVESFLQFAKENVCPESWFDKNVFNDDKST
jgi:hypothetical protein